MQYVYRKEGRWMSYLNQGGQRQPTPPQLRIWQGFWRRVWALYTIQIWVRLSVCLTDCLAASVSFLLILPPSQRILFSATQMFGVVCCAALSCVYNKEVLVWRRREGSEVGEWVLLRRGGGHCAVGVNTGWCQLSLGPPTSQYSIPFFLFSSPHIPFYFPEGQMHLHVSWRSYSEASRGGRDPLRGDDVHLVLQLKLLTYSPKRLL